VPSSGTFLLTRNAALDLRRIHSPSRRERGEDVADQYLADLYAVMGMAAANPARGRSRQHRSAPFLMVPARQHFLIYERGLA
jgi:toxin ParE1/3/4